ncbi:hypothetical protein WA026_020468 [Henosepilachna vigintioctopunctata]|uniref:DUF4371 domain-containing protein n=1 Tax=Henosepilachna vigintioctopunctata TaxID=420089 RepID=A0AAW1VH66_9CUCU
MAEIMCGQKESKKQNSVTLFARILDEATDFSSNSQLMVYVRYKCADNFEEELLFCSSLKLRSRGIDVYNKVDEYFNAQRKKFCQRLDWKLQYWRQKVEYNKISSCYILLFQGYKYKNLIKLNLKAVFRLLPDLHMRSVSWIVDPLKCEIAIIPEEPSGLAEAILELRSNTEARIQFESKPNLSSFWMSKAAKAFKIAHEEAVKNCCHLEQHIF